MKPTRQLSTVLCLCGCAWVALGSTGCQSTVGGQTLPSAYYLRDDVQYFPPGPEFILAKQVEAIEEYKLRQEGLESSTNDRSRERERDSQ